MRYALAVVVVGFMSVAAADALVPEEGNLVTKDRPTAREVAAAIARDYANPKLLVLTARVRSDEVISWSQTFDGVPVHLGWKSVRFGQDWQTRFSRDLRGPEPVRRDALITKDAARAKAELPSGEVLLFFRPVFKQVQRPGTKGKTATDYVQMIERYDLVYRVADSAKDVLVLVDAYSGEIRGRGTLRIID